ncbi:MAG TPA: hypothetical protein VF783_24365, partial [Terriglobales bacterium]
MLPAFKLFTGPADASHVIEGTVAHNDPSEAAPVYFKESPPDSSLNWHDAPERQYVVTLSGMLEFTTRDGETFLLRPRGCSAGCRQRQERSQMAADRRPALA